MDRSGALFFDDLAILRHPGYNVATWNLYYRRFAKAGTNFEVDGLPLRFFHFSGFDISTHRLMMQRHAPDNKDLRDLTDWYIERQKDLGQKYASSLVGFYDRFADGSRIPKELRVWFRNNPEVFSRCPAPYEAPSLLGDFRAMRRRVAWHRLWHRLTTGVPRRVSRMLKPMRA